MHNKSISRYKQSNKFKNAALVQATNTTSYSCPPLLFSPHLPIVIAPKLPISEVSTHNHSGQSCTISLLLQGSQSSPERERESERVWLEKWSDFPPGFSVRFVLKNGKTSPEENETETKINYTPKKAGAAREVLSVNLILLQESEFPPQVLLPSNEDTDDGRDEIFLQRSSFPAVEPCSWHSTENCKKSKNLDKLINCL